MSAALIILLVGVAGLALVALLLIRDSDLRIRLATVAGAIGGFVFALLLALALGTDGLAAFATATLGAAVLALALIVQWRFIRSLFARQGRKL